MWEAMKMSVFSNAYCSTLNALETTLQPMTTSTAACLCCQRVLHGKVIQRFHMLWGRPDAAYPIHL